MELISTTQCGKYAHPEFHLLYDSAKVLEVDVRWFVGTLERMVAAGEKFSDGQSYQLGWTFMLIKANDEGSLGFMEPEMSRMPIEWEPGVTHALRHLRLHKDVVESVLPAESLSFPSLRQSCLVCTKVDQAGTLLMDRLDSKGDDSGWFIGCGDRAHDHNSVENLERVSLYEAAVSLAPPVLPFLALPAGAFVGLRGGPPVIFYEDKELEIRTGSYLQRLFEHQG